MKITIDTSQDSKEDIRKVVALLSNYLSSSESSVISSSSGIFPEPVSDSGFFGADNSNSIGLGDENVVNTVASASTSSSNSLSNNNSIGSNASPPQTQEQQMPFINMFGDDNSAGAGNSNSGSNVLSNESSAGNNNLAGNNLGSAINVPSQTSSAPDIFSVFGSANNNSNNSQNNVGGIGANNYNNSNNIGTGINNLGSSTAAAPKKTFAGIFKGIPILGNLSFGQDDQNEELTEEEKAAEKKVVEY